MDIKPLTILAGENSAGKSSVMQPLLLLKQSIERNFEPEALLLNGANVKFTEVNQVLSHLKSGKRLDNFYITLNVGSDRYLKLCFSKEEKHFIVTETIFKDKDGKINLKRKMEHEEIIEIKHPAIETILALSKRSKENGEIKLTVTQDRCFLTVDAELENQTLTLALPSRLFQWDISRIIHVPAARGKLQRNYPVTAVGPIYQGTFEDYVGSIIAHWQREDRKKLKTLRYFLKALDLTWFVEAIRRDASSIEVNVGQFKKSTIGYHVINVADAGFGLSQCLPVLVALIAAEEGQMVYLEEPEIHLHPNAQYELARVLTDAAMRGVKVVVETHSTYLLLCLQTQVARKELNNEDVSLYWFSRDKEGETQIEEGTFDLLGRYGNWPVKFDDILLRIQREYYIAARKRLREEKGQGKLELDS